MYNCLKKQRTTSLRQLLGAGVAVWLLVPILFPRQMTVGAAPVFIVLRGGPQRALCTGGIALRCILHLPKPAGNLTDRLTPGLVWLGSNSVAAAGARAVYRWRFRGSPAHCKVLMSAAPGHYFARAYGSSRRVLVSILTASGNAAVLAALLPKRAIRGFSGPPNSQILRGGPAGADVRWRSAAVPRTLAWLAAISLLPDHRRQITVCRIGRGQPRRSHLPLSEPEVQLFASADGGWLAWVDGGHWLHALNMSRRSGIVHGQRIFTREGLRYGALSPHGQKVLLVASHWSTGGAVRLISIRRVSPATERVLTLWPDDQGAVCACPPNYSPSGLLAAAATFRYGTREPVDVYVVSAGRLAILCRISLKGDMPIALAFSGDGSELAVECWYHVYIFRLPQHFLSLSQRRYHEPTWSQDWTHPVVRKLPVGELGIAKK